ncbi:MAG: NAD-dependent epimerase/dehydratase family protein [Lentisphaeria bacterium]
MQVLIFGGTGNISSDFVSLLLEQGNDVTLLNRGNHPPVAGCQNLIADCSDGNAVKKALAGKTFDVVVDFICFTPEDAKNAYNAIRERCGHFIFISTAVVYAKPPAMIPIREDAPKGNRFSEYGQLKWAAEQFFMEKFEKENFPVTIIRPSHTYSKKWIPNPLTSAGYNFASRIEHGQPVFVHDDGRGLWTLTHSRDFARPLAALCKNAESIGEDYNLTSDHVMTWNEIILEIAYALGEYEPKIEYIPTDFICKVLPFMHDKLVGDKMHPGVFDNTKLKKAVHGFDCEITFAQGIRESIAWFKEDLARQVINPVIDRQYQQLLTAWGKK